MGTRLGEGRTCECREKGHGDFKFCSPLSAHPKTQRPKDLLYQGVLKSTTWEEDVKENFKGKGHDNCCNGEKDTGVKSSNLAK